MVVSKYNVIIDTGFLDPQWDTFLSESENGHHEQSTYWAKYKKYYGWQPFRLKVVRDGRIEAGAQMLCKRRPVLGAVGFISCGPCYSRENVSALKLLVRSINRLARQKSVRYLAITPYSDDCLLSEILSENGYSYKAELLPPSSTTIATLLLDLRMEIPQILNHMRYETRRLIKIATKTGLNVRIGKKEDLSQLFKLMSLTADRRGERPVPENVEAFKFIWDCYHDNGLVQLFLAEADGTPLSAAFIFPFGDTVRFWKFGWSGKFPKKYPNHYLYWELIKWSKDNGFRHFDIVQVAPEIADHLLAGLPVTEDMKSNRLFGPTLFKTGFGGKVVKFSGPWCRFKNPMVNNLYRHFGSSILKSPYMNKLIARIL